jgi:hypothetical protein
VLRICVILVRIRIRIRLFLSVTFKLATMKKLCFLFTLDHGFSYYFCLTIEGCESGRPEIIWILRIQIRSTEKYSYCILYRKCFFVNFVTFFLCCPIFLIVRLFILNCIVFCKPFSDTLNLRLK